MVHLETHPVLQSTTPESSSGGSFVVPEEYKGIEVFDGSPEADKKSIIEHYEDHHQVLDLAIKKLREASLKTGLESDTKKIEAIQKTMTFLENEIIAVEKIDGYDAKAMFPIQLKHQAIINELHTFEKEHNIDYYHYSHEPDLAA